MSTSLVGQSGSNMHRRIILVLLLYGLLGFARCSVLRERVPSGDSASIVCDERGNSTACGSRRSRVIENAADRTGIRIARVIRGEDFTERGVESEEVSSRKKKDKGQGNWPLYLLGASKLTMLYVIVNTVAAIAGKALITAKIALAIATAILLNKSSEHHQKVSYEIIKHPHHSNEHTYSSSIDYDHYGSFGESEYNRRSRRRIYH